MSEVLVSVNPTPSITPVAPSVTGAPGGAGSGTIKNASLTPAFISAVVKRIRDSSDSILKLQKPWSEVLDRSTLSRPSNLGEAFSRIKTNVSYFRVNYFIVMLATCIMTFVMHPTSLFVLGLLLVTWVYVLFIRQTPIEIGGRTLGDREKLMGMSALSFITVFFLTNVGAVLFSGLTFSAAVIALHGAFREPDSLFLDNPSDTPFLSLLTGSSPVKTALATAV